jgi:hypothetical protein
MNTPNDSGPETCVVCGKAVAGTSGVTHIYQAGRPFALCCPVCVDMFQRAPARFASGERPQSVVEDLLADLKWKNSSRW